MSDYNAFLKKKSPAVGAVGVDVKASDLHPALFPFQRDLVRWALKKGRAALFTSTGTGKTLMDLSFALHAGERVLMVAPLAVARQTVREGEKFGIPVKYARSEAQSAPSGITITNYELIERFDVDRYPAMVADESAILKAYDGKTRNLLINLFRDTPMKLCSTAVPAPNDIAEIASHSEFLGVMTRVEMLAAFFVHRDTGWSLKGHAAKGPFWKWLASWSMSIRRPSDLGYSDEGYILPELSIRQVVVECDYVPEGRLFADHIHGITEQAKVRKATTPARVKAAAELVAREPNEQWLLWCGTNEESASLAKAIPGAVEVKGSDSPDSKADRLMAFAEAKFRVLVTKSDIAGFGLNLQSCSRMIFVGIGYSFEQYYQSIRRCWRFGQTRPVHCYIVVSDIEQDIYQLVLKKEAEAEMLSENLVKHVAEFERSEIGHRVENISAGKEKLVLPNWMKK